MDKEKFFELATKILSHEATEREREELNTYLNDENYSKQYSYLKSSWEELKLPEDDTHFDIKKGLNKLHAKINEYTVPELTYLQKKNFRKIVWSSNLLRIAASFIFLVLILFSLVI